MISKMIYLDLPLSSFSLCTNHNMLYQQLNIYYKICEKCSFPRFIGEREREREREREMGYTDISMELP